MTTEMAPSAASFLFLGLMAVLYAWLRERERRVMPQVILGLGPKLLLILRSLAQEKERFEGVLAGTGLTVLKVRPILQVPGKVCPVLPQAHVEAVLMRGSLGLHWVAYFWMLESETKAYMAVRLARKGWWCPERFSVMPLREFVSLPLPPRELPEKKSLVPPVTGPLPW